MLDIRALRTLSTGYIPRSLKASSRGGQTDSVRYCYSVWLRHLGMLHANGLPTSFETVAELGPGRTCGIGLAALLSGSKSYVGLDVVSYKELQHNVALLYDLAELYERKERIPDDAEFPEIKPKLKSYGFPTEALDFARLKESRSTSHLLSIKKDIAGEREEIVNRPIFQYVVPWNDPDVVDRGSVDLIFSQAVLEHVEDLDGAYQAMSMWLRPGGLMSHQIDFKCHGTASKWNGHWCYSDFWWRAIKGNRPYLINREPLSTHLKFLKKHGFETVVVQSVTQRNDIERHRLADRFSDLSDGDLTTSGAYILSRKLGVS